MYIHELRDWPRFRWNVQQLAESLVSVRQAWPLVSEVVRDQFPDGRRYYLNFRNLVVRPSSLGGEAAIIGACTLPVMHLFA